MSTCAGTTLRGQCCKKKAARGSDFCHHHQQTSPQTPTRFLESPHRRNSHLSSSIYADSDFGDSESVRRLSSQASPSWGPARSNRGESTPELPTSPSPSQSRSRYPYRNSSAGYFPSFATVVADEGMYPHERRFESSHRSRESFLDHEEQTQEAGQMHEAERVPQQPTHHLVDRTIRHSSPSSHSGRSQHQQRSYHHTWDTQGDNHTDNGSASSHLPPLPPTSDHDQPVSSPPQHYRHVQHHTPTAPPPPSSLPSPPPASTNAPTTPPKQSAPASPTPEPTPGTYNGVQAIALTSPLTAARPDAYVYYKATPPPTSAASATTPEIPAASAHAPAPPVAKPPPAPEQPQKHTAASAPAAAAAAAAAAPLVSAIDEILRILAGEVLPRLDAGDRAAVVACWEVQEGVERLRREIRRKVEGGKR